MIGGMDEEVPLLAALGLGALQCMCGVAVVLVTRRAAAGRLGRNAVAGIRIASTLRSDAAWRQGHAAAVRLSDVGGAVFVLSGLLAVVSRSAPVFASVLLTGVVFGSALLLAGAWRAARAAEEAEQAEPPHAL